MIVKITPREGGETLILGCDDVEKLIDQFGEFAKIEVVRDNRPCLITQRLEQTQGTITQIRAITQGLEARLAKTEACVKVRCPECDSPMFVVDVVVFGELVEVIASDPCPACKLRNENE